MLQIAASSPPQKTTLQRFLPPHMARHHSTGDPSSFLGFSSDCRPLCVDSRPSAVKSSQSAAQLPDLDDRVGVPAFDRCQHRSASRDVCSSDSFGNPGVQQLRLPVYVPDQRIAADRSSRVALLRERFADTIYNAHEKQRLLLHQNDAAERQIVSKQLPFVQRRRWERKGRSQFKRSFRNEKAKALAEARLRAKAELEKCMQQTVEIDENSGISNVLKRFESAFARYGRTPLERLGLFLKADADE